MIIRALKESEIQGLNALPPGDWNFDYEDFLSEFLRDDFFYAFVMIYDKQIIGTGNVLLKEKIGWLANIIVDKKNRGRGLGFSMTKFLVDFLNRKGCETQLLIATKPGEPVYQKIGFKKVTAYQCFDTIAEKEFNYPHAIRELADSDRQHVYQLDQDANGEDRAHLIDKFYSTGFGYFNHKDELSGCYLPDFGRGLVLARNKEAGIELLKLKHAKKGKRTLLPVDNQAGIDFLGQEGLTRGDTCTRMILGKEINWNPKYIYSYGSGYCG